MQLHDRVALVTGGSRGIGRGIVEQLAGAGAKVAFVYRGNQAAAAELVDQVEASGGTIQALQGDVQEPATATSHVEKVVADWGKIDILVNNAGIIHDDLFIRLDPTHWDRVLATNLNGTFHYCKALAYPMMKQRFGRIINISSVAAVHVNAGQTNYAASKGAINAFTRALAVELASKGVTVNAIAPGFIATDMSASVRNKAGDIIEKKLIPTRRLGQPEDIAALVVFLASDAASYITGQVITVDGGLSLGAVSP